MTKNRQATKAMAAIENRLSSRRTAVITRDEFEAIGDYIEELEHNNHMLACEAHSYLSQLIQPEDYE